mmetsp:Transcript_6708/g.22311  ORF Transcript_6708/g.22311 Transcript_6708/m.22311 type:complete len:521 (+) Transcript_6708:452-2014(+)
MSATDGDYEAALGALSTLISGQKRSDGRTWSSAFDAMGVYIDRLELHDAIEYLSPRAIHVAGTKGKGSTCAFAERILREQGVRTGMFTSPHLVDVRERMRIDGAPVSEAVFLEHFWWCFRRLQETATEEVGMPAYFRFMLLLSLRVFHAERVQGLVLEVGLGGRLDATNVVPAPAVCGVASLGYDHCELLGHTLPEIAREKAGIFKKGVPAFSAPQEADAMAALAAVASDVGAAPFAESPALETALEEAPQTLGLAGAHQRTNAALALALARTWAQRTPDPPADAASAEQALAERKLPPAYARALAQASWPGRAQTVTDIPDAPALTLFLDGAHTPESAAACGAWFADAAPAEMAMTGDAEPGTVAAERVLLFSCKPEREPQKLLTPLVAALAERSLPFHRAVFVPMESLGASLAPTAGHQPVDLSWERSLCAAWDQAAAPQHPPQQQQPPPAWPAPLPPGSEAGPRSAVLPSLVAALDWCKTAAKAQAKTHPRGGRVQVLVTGSLYLVGDVLRIMRRIT